MRSRLDMQSLLDSLTLSIYLKLNKNFIHSYCLLALFLFMILSGLVATRLQHGGSSQPFYSYKVTQGYKAVD